MPHAQSLAESPYEGFGLGLLTFAEAVGMNERVLFRLRGALEQVTE